MQPRYDSSSAGGHSVGQSVEQMKKEKILAVWGAKYSGKFIASDLFIETLYNSLTNQKNAEFVKHI